MGESKNNIRFGDYARGVQANYTQISYNDLTKPSDKERSKSIALRPKDIYRLV